MDYSPRSRTDARVVNSESSTSSIYLPEHANVIYPQDLGLSNLNMYAANQSADCQHPDLGDSVKNSSLGTYPTKQSLNSANVVIDQQPRKEGLWQNIVRSVSNLMSDRGTGSLIRSWSSMSSPLSVTVVSPDLFKSLHRDGHETTTAMVDETSSFPVKSWFSNMDSPNSDETLASVLYGNEIVSGSANSGVKQCDKSSVGVSDLNDVDKRWREYKCMYVDFNKAQKDAKTSEEIINSINTTMNQCEDNALESQFDIIINNEEDLDKSANFGSSLSIDDEPVILEPLSTPELESEYPVKTHENQESQPQPQTHEETPKTVTPVPTETSVVDKLTNGFKQMVNAATDLLQLRSISPEPEPTAHFTKRSGPCTKPKPKKIYTISSGRGRGRAKSQLRKSGVSQKRHRKQRSRYDRLDEIKFDLNHWEELENDVSEEESESMDVCDFGGNIASMHKRQLTLDLEEIKPTMKKQKKKNLESTNLSKFCTKLNLNDIDSDEDEDDENGSEDDDDEDEDDESDDVFSEDDESDDSESDDSEEEVVHFCSTARIRLSSISSVDSDDSFVVFKDSSTSDLEVETEKKTETDAETEDRNEDSGDDSDFDIDSWQPSKIRFNLTPVVHRMIHWGFAYKAARRGHWEQLVTDRLRFRRRIMDVDPILKGVLTPKHRERIWNERFAENVSTCTV